MTPNSVAIQVVVWAANSQPWVRCLWSLWLASELGAGAGGLLCMEGHISVFLPATALTQQPTQVSLSLHWIALWLGGVAAASSFR